MLKLLKALADCRNGNFALLTAILAVPVIGAAGMSVDLTRAILKRSDLQSALDAAVLAAASTTTTDRKKIDAEAKAMLLSNLPTDLSANTTSDDLVFHEDGRVSLSAATYVPLSVGKILFEEGLRVSASATAIRGNAYKVEVAMALDNTYSMTGQKLTDLKLAANKLIDVFSKDKEGETRIALVPFSNYVNVGLNNRSKSWIDVPSDYSETKNICSKSKPVIGKSGCRQVPYTYVSDGITINSTREECQSYTYGPEVTTCSDRVSNYTWRGCVGSRPHPYDVENTQPLRKYMGLLNVNCSAALLPLTSNYAALRTAIKKMVATQETYIPAGILWGWNALSPTEPLEEAEPYGDYIKKYLIVMTDGANTLSPNKSNYTVHSGKDTAQADMLMSSVCSNAKAAGITIFTVAVGISGTSTAGALARCATDTSTAISVEDTEKLVEIFDDIGNRIMMPRLTQ